MMITLIVGTVPLLQQRALEQLRQAAPTASEDSWQGDDDVTELITACTHLSLWSDERRILIKQAQLLPAAAQEALLPYLDRLPESIHLIFIADQIDRRLKFWKAVSQIAEVIAADPPPPRELRRWLQAEWQRRGKKVSPVALDVMTEWGQQDFVRALQWIEVVDLYTEGSGDRTRRDIDVPVLEQCRGSLLRSSVFALTEAVAAQQWTEAAAVLRRLMGYDENPHAVLSLLVREFRLLLRAKEAEQEGWDERTLQQALGVPPFVVARYRTGARSFSRAGLLRCWQLLREADADLKSLGGEKRWVLERLLFRLRSEATEAAMQA